ncbi:MAG TPA: recombinase RecA [Halothiobacillaceae bacterium]|nr:recombinase RecA [Halothiobacillaceae bacterium]
MKEDGRFRALETTMKSIHKRYGEGAIMRLGQAEHLHVETIPTGSLALDLALGVGGVPRGRVTEIYGPEGSGKTTICQHIVAEAQRMGGVAAFIDMEHALDPIYASKCGVDVDELYISQPDTGEQALEIAEALVRSGAVDVIVVDSVAALVPRAEIEGEMGDSHPGLQARLMSQALRKLSGAIKVSNTAMVFTNQLRHKIGVMFGSPETTSGGMALKFYASVRLDIRRIQAIKLGGEVVGNRTRIKIKKNKVAPPFRECEFDIMYDEGVSKEGDVLDLGVELDIIGKRGSFYYYKEDQLAQGRENTKMVLRENPALCLEIENAIRQETGLPLLDTSSVLAQLKEEGLVEATQEAGDELPAKEAKVARAVKATATSTPDEDSDDFEQDDEGYEDLDDEEDSVEDD